MFECCQPRMSSQKGSTEQRELTLMIQINAEEGKSERNNRFERT